MRKIIVISSDKGGHEHVHEHTENAHINIPDQGQTAMHFDENTGMAAVEKPRWTVQQIAEATKSLSFPAGTTVWDKYVAYNKFYDGMRNVLSEEQILRAAYVFFFADTCAPKSKVWLYVQALSKK